MTAQGLAPGGADAIAIADIAALDAVQRAAKEPERKARIKTQILEIDAWPHVAKMILNGISWRDWPRLPAAERAARCKERFMLLTMDEEAADWIEIENWTGGNPPTSPDECRAERRAGLVRELELSNDELAARAAKAAEDRSIGRMSWAASLGLDISKEWKVAELSEATDASLARLLANAEPTRVALQGAAHEAKTDAVAACIMTPDLLTPAGQRRPDDYHAHEVGRVQSAALSAIQEATRDRQASFGKVANVKPVDSQEVRTRAAEFAGIARAAVDGVLAGRRFVTPPDWLGPNPEQTPESIWSERPELAHLLSAARTMKLSPWALLGQTLTRAAAMIPYYVPFRSFLGSRPVNLLVAVAGSTGTGKTAAESAVADVFRWPVDLGHVLEAGSGEAIPSAYAYAAPKADKELNIQKGELIWRHDDRLARFGFDEVGRLNAVQGRQGATVLEYLKSAESGASLGRILASGEGVQLPAKEYRFTATINVQPERAHLITSADEAAGGLPGRMLWVSAEYAPFAGMPRSRVRIEPYPLAHLNWTIVQAIESLPVMDEVFEAQQDAALAGELDPMESHGALLRAKVACCLMVLAGRQALIDDDWSAAGLIMGNSRRVRGEVLKGLVGDGDDLKPSERMQSMNVIAKMKGHKAAGLTMGAARKKLAGRDRPIWDKAILQRDDLAW